MENTFNFNRFMLLVRRQWIGLGKIYLMAWGVLAGVFIVLFSFALRSVDGTSDPRELYNLLSFRAYLFVLIGLLYITVISGSYFANLGKKANAISELLLPASHLEKFLTALLYTFVITSVSYFLIFFLVDVGFVIYLRSVATNFLLSQGESINGINMDRLPYFFTTDYVREVYYFLFLPYLLSAIFLLGSIYFVSFQYIKTAISLFIYIFLVVFCIYLTNRWFWEGTILSQRNTFWDDDTTILRSILVVGILLTVLFWGVSYLRLKEKEV